MKKITICLMLITAAFTMGSSLKKYSHTPKEGFVPNARTAILIAEAVLFPIYGEEKIKAQRPFQAALKDGLWTVTGSLPIPEDKNIQVLGGVAIVQIHKSTGAIEAVAHSE